MATKTKPKFKIGDKVTFTFGARRAKGFIVEHRGRVGVDRRQRYGVRLDMDPFESMFLERSEVDIEPSPEPETPLTSEEIADYLARGGLLLMLSKDWRDQAPRVWLKRDNLENVTHTFVEGRGLAGGAPLPVSAFANRKVLPEKRDDAREFIMSFGLTKEEADAVVDRIGVKRNGRAANGQSGN